MATAVDKQTLYAEKSLKKRGENSGSKPVQHAAELLEAHNEMVAEKNLTKRFKRIGLQMKALKEQSPSDWERSQKQVKALRPLLRLAVRSSEFRQSGISFLKVLKNDVFNEKPVVDKAKEKKEEGKDKKNYDKDKSKSKEGHHEKHKEGKHAAGEYKEGKHGEAHHEKSKEDKEKLKKKEAEEFAQKLDKNLARDSELERQREFGAMNARPGIQSTYMNPIPAPTMPAPAPATLVPASAILTGGSLGDEIKQAVEKKMAKDQTEGKYLHEEERYKEGKLVGVHEKSIVEGKDLHEKEGYKEGKHVEGHEKPKTKEGKDLEKEKHKEGKHVEGHEKSKSMKGKEKEKSRDSEKKGPKKRKISDEAWLKMTKPLNRIFKVWTSHSEYQQGIRELFDLPQLIINEGNKNAHVPAAEGLQEETRDLIAQFSGRKVLDKLFHEMQKLHDSSNEDTRRWWFDFKKIVIHTMDDYDGKEDLTPLRHHFDKSFPIFDTFRPRINRIIDLITEIFENMSNDKYVQGLRERLSIVADDLTWKKDETRVVDVDAIGELSVALAEILRKQLTTIKMPDIKGSNRRGSYEISHLKIKNTIPDQLRFRLESEAVVDTLAGAKNKLKTELILSASVYGIRTEIHDMHFSFSGMLSDSGIADVLIPSSDLAIDFIYAPKRIKESGTTPGVNVANDTFLRFVNMRSHFNVSDLQINWHKDTLSHKTLLPLGTKLYKKQLVKNLELGVQNAMNENIEVVGEKMANVLQKSPSMASIGNFRFANKDLRKKHEKDVLREQSIKKHGISDKKHHDVASKSSPKIDRHHAMDTHA